MKLTGQSKKHFNKFNYYREINKLKMTTNWHPVCNKFIKLMTKHRPRDHRLASEKGRQAEMVQSRGQTVFSVL